MFRSAALVLALLLAPPAAASPLPAPPDAEAAAVEIVTAMLNTAGIKHCHITGYRMARDGYETLFDDDFMARRTPGARATVTIFCPA